MADLTKDEIASKLKGIERYNPLHVDILTEYLEAQCKNNQYDLEANQALLKLYQFNPALFKSDIVEKVLLKALTNLPHPDFILCELLIDSSKLGQGHIQDIIELHKQLELCQFSTFWADIVKHKELYKDIVGFEESEITGFKDKDEEYKNLLKQRDWKLGDDGYVLVASQEDTIKTINITEKIELEQVANILATYR